MGIVEGERFFISGIGKLFKAEEDSKLGILSKDAKEGGCIN